MQEIDFSTLKVINYNRKSQDSDDKQALSIPAQKQEALQLAQKLKITNFTVYDEAKSAKTPNARRMFSQMITDLLSGKSNAILCWKIDRLARNMAEGGQIIDLLQRGIIKVIITPSKNYYPNENALLMALEFGSANQFSRDLSVNVKRGQTTKARKGIPHGLAALGFRNDKTEEKGNRKWLVDQVRLDQIKYLFDEYLTGTWSVNRLAKHAREDLKLTTPTHKRNGGNLIAISRLNTLLKDPIYAGFFYYNNERYELTSELPRLITEEQHELIKKMISRKNLPKGQKQVLTYTGFIKSPFDEFIGQDTKYQVICDCKFKFCYLNKEYCPKCNKLITDIQHPVYLNYVFYYNVNRRKKKLGTKSLNEKVVEKYLIDYFDTHLHLSSAFAEWSKKYIHELKNNEIEAARIKSKSQKDFKNTMQHKKKKLRDLLARDLITEEEYRSDVSDIDDKEAYSDNQNDSTKWFDEINNIIDLSQNMQDILKNGTVKAKREVLTMLGSNLIWNEENLDIVNTKPIQVLIDGLCEARAKNTKFEPKNTLADKDKTEVFASVRPMMLPLLDMFRTLNWTSIKSELQFSGLLPNLIGSY